MTKRPGRSRSQPDVFVHGCFWRQDKRRWIASVPKSNEAFWEVKFARKVERDGASIAMLEADGWRVMTV